MLGVDPPTSATTCIQTDMRCATTFMTNVVYQSFGMVIHRLRYDCIRIEIDGTLCDHLVAEMFLFRLVLA